MLLKVLSQMKAAPFLNLILHRELLNKLLTNHTSDRLQLWNLPGLFTWLSLPWIYRCSVVINMKYYLLPSLFLYQTLLPFLPRQITFVTSKYTIQVFFMMKIYNKLFKALPSSNEGLTIVKSALKLFTVVNLRYQLNW